MEKQRNLVNFTQQMQEPGFKSKHFGLVNHILNHYSDVLQMVIALFMDIKP